MTVETLTFADFTQYHNFFMKTHPNCKNTDWLYDYYVEIVTENLCCGLFTNNTLVSCSDSPDMPYMKNEVQEIGINTLDEYKGHGYATDVCIRTSKEILNNSKCPQWSTMIDNVASQKLALKTGFVKLADVLTITL